MVGSVTPQRLPEMPNTPTFRDQGLDYVYDAWFGLMAPAGVPKDIIAKVNRDVVEILKSPATKAKLAGPVPGRPRRHAGAVRQDSSATRPRQMTEAFKEITN